MLDPPRLTADISIKERDDYAGSETGLHLRSRRTVACITAGLAIVLGTAFYLIASTPTAGVVMVESAHSEDLKRILDENGMVLWTGIGKFGWLSVRFDNPFALRVIDDQLLADARAGKYRCRIRYECVWSIFDYERSAK